MSFKIKISPVVTVIIKLLPLINGGVQAHRSFLHTSLKQSVWRPQLCPQAINLLYNRLLNLLVSHLYNMTKPEKTWLDEGKVHSCEASNY